MSGKSHSYSLTAIHDLLNEAFDDPKLDSFCMDHFSYTYDKFSYGMRKDVKINCLLHDCRKNVPELQRLLGIVRDKVPGIYQKFEIRLVRTKTEEPLISDKISTTDPISLLDELKEWKLVHHNVQSLLNKLEAVFGYLDEYSFTNNPHSLRRAGLAWQRYCVNTLKSIFDKWQLQYANTPELALLREEIIVIEPIARELMSEITNYQFNELHLWFAGFRGLLWDILTIADTRIMVLVENLRSMMSGVN